MNLILRVNEYNTITFAKIIPVPDSSRRRGLKYFGEENRPKRGDLALTVDCLEDCIEYISVYSNSMEVHSWLMEVFV